MAKQGSKKKGEAETAGGRQKKAWQIAHMEALPLKSVAASASIEAKLTDFNEPHRGDVLRRGWSQVSHVASDLRIELPPRCSLWS